MRGILLNTMMLHWKDKPKRAVKSLVWSSVVFGLLHLGNLLMENTYWVVVAFQIVFAASIGFAFGAVYLRTKNIWPLIAVHMLVDLFSMLDFATAPMNSDAVGETGVAWFLQALGGRLPGLLMLIGHIVPVVFGLVLVRKSKREEIDRLWAESPAQLPA